MKPIAKIVPAPEVKPGTRAFIVGNGKSLTGDQLDKLIGEVSFAVNRIHLIYGDTRWRPTYWVVTDLDNTDVYLRDIPLHAKQDYMCYARADILARVVAAWLGEMPNKEILAMMDNCRPLDYVNYIRKDTRDTEMPWIDGKYNQGGSVACAQQLALAWGYNPVYMIGCEGDLKAGEINHFTGEYADFKHDERNSIQMGIANDILQLVDEIAKKEYYLRHREIYNATVGGSKRTAIPATDFWRLFDE